MIVFEEEFREFDDMNDALSYFRYRNKMEKKIKERIAELDILAGFVDGFLDQDKHYYTGNCRNRF